MPFLTWNRLKRKPCPGPQLAGQQRVVDEFVDRGGKSKVIACGNIFGMAFRAYYLGYAVI